MNFRAPIRVSQFARRAYGTRNYDFTALASAVRCLVPALSKIRSAFAAFGLFAGSLYLLQRALQLRNAPLRLLFYDLMSQPVANTELASPRLTAAVVVRDITSDAESLAKLPRPKEVIDFRLEQKVVCLGAFRKNTLIAAQWFCFGPYEEDEVRCSFVPRPASHAVFDFDTFVFPEHRLGTAFAALWEGVNKYLRGRDISHTCSRISRFNVASRNAHVRLGATRTGSAVFLAGRNRQLMIASVRPFVYFSRQGKKGPNVVIGT